MEAVVLVTHLILALAIIGLVLLQRSEGGGLGIGGGGGGLGNVLTKATTYCAIAFFCTSMALGVIAKSKSETSQTLLSALEEVHEEEGTDASVPLVDEVLDSDAVSGSAPVSDDSDIPDVPIKE